MGNPTDAGPQQPRQRPDPFLAMLEAIAEWALVTYGEPIKEVRIQFWREGMEARFPIPAVLPRQGPAAR